MADENDPTDTPAPAPAAPPPMPGAPSAPPLGSNGFAVAALVLGILSLVLFFTVWIPIVLGVLAIIFGALGIGRANRGAPQKGLALAGLICGIAGIVVAIAFIALLVTVLDRETQTVFNSFGSDVGPALVRR